ncbi:MAG TPA: glycosyltransferase family 2 protein [Caulobacterales bacterium]|nr:glycosyltransferase family 2 protein [Caulobacterales bacterium]
MTRVHLHTVCWNDRPMLDFFFRHYEPWVERFFIHDDGSDDGSREYLEARANVAVERLKRTDPNSWVKSAKHIYDTSWKRSRGAADWVIVTNIDEHLHHADMPRYLAIATERGVTAIPALGYQMIADDFPPTESLLWRDFPMGAPWRNMSKLQIFQPDAIEEINYGPGRHLAEPLGDVRYPERDEVVNLHYKYLGLARTQARHEQQERRLGDVDRAKNWGHKYRWTPDQLGADFETVRAALVDTRGLDHHAAHAEPRWWR